MSRHRADRELRAWRDGELSPWRRLSLQLHVRRCGGCGGRVVEMDRERRLLTQLLAPREPPLDLGEAWSRLQVRSGRPVRRPVFAGSIAGAATVAGGLALAAVAVLFRPPNWTAEVDWLLHPTPVRAKISSTDDTRFVKRLLRLEAAGKVFILQDACCEDRDGEGPADDGLAIVQVTGRQATLAVLYEDLDGSGALTSGDLIRLVSRMSDDDLQASRASHRPSSSRASPPADLATF